MRRAINKSVLMFAETFAPAGPVIELGAYYLPGYEQLSDLRRHFPGREYIGCDIRRGPGVDRIEDAQALSFGAGSVGAVLLFEILEHLPDPRAAIAEARRVLRDDGLLAVSVPFMYRLHGFPTDYWRFTASGIHQLLGEFPDKIVFALGPKVKPALIFAVASKRASAEFTAHKQVFRASVEAEFRRSIWRGHASVFKDRARDFLGHLLGRADLQARFFDSSIGGGYTGR